MSTKRKFRIGPVVRNFDELFQHDYFMIQQGMSAAKERRRSSAPAKGDGAIRPSMRGRGNM